VSGVSIIAPEVVELVLVARVSVSFKEMVEFLSVGDVDKGRFTVRKVFVEMSVAKVWVLGSEFTSGCWMMPLLEIFWEWPSILAEIVPTGGGIWFTFSIKLSSPSLDWVAGALERFF
jgi:hypothetical protein